MSDQSTWLCHRSPSASCDVGDVATRAPPHRSLSVSCAPVRCRYVQAGVSLRRYSLVFVLPFPRDVNKRRLNGACSGCMHTCDEIALVSAIRQEKSRRVVLRFIRAWRFARVYCCQTLNAVPHAARWSSCPCRR